MHLYIHLKVKFNANAIDKIYAIIIIMINFLTQEGTRSCHA
jgi:hypothetical protein